MNLKTWLPLCLAIVLGLVAAKFAHDMIARNRATPAVGGKFVQVVVASRAIGAGEALTSENCKLGNVDSENVPQASFHAVTELQSNARVAQVQLGAGQPVTENLLAPIGTGVGLQAVIPPGMRAITIEVNEFSGVGGMLLPGCHVDVLATVPGDNGGEMIARTIVQDVQISAVGQRMVSQPVEEKKGDGQQQAFRSVTLLATPEEAETIELAAASGRPRLVLRSGADKTIARTSGVTAASLRGPAMSKPVVAPPVVAVATPPTVIIPKTENNYWTVKVIRGGQESEVRFQLTGSGTGGTTGVSNSETTPATGH
jgi:pilus assembly protein CpaB